MLINRVATFSKLWVIIIRLMWKKNRKILGDIIKCFFFHDMWHIIMFVSTEFRNISIQLNLVPFDWLL